MKWISISLIFLLPLFAFSQSDYSLKNGIGVHLTQDDSKGLGLSIRFSKQIVDQGILKLEFRSNWNGDYVGRIGYEFLQLEINRFGLGVGIDLKYQCVSLKDIGYPNYNELAFEVPLELRYYFSQKYFIQSGISFAYRIRSSTGSQYSATSLAELRVGIGYKF